MDIDQSIQEPALAVQALANRNSGNKLDAIKSLDAMLLKKTAEREKQDKDKRLQEKFKVCKELPEDWTLKTELELQVPLN